MREWDTESQGRKPTMEVPPAQAVLGQNAVSSEEKWASPDFQEISPDAWVLHRHER